MNDYKLANLIKEQKEMITDFKNMAVEIKTLNELEILQKKVDKQSLVLEIMNEDRLNVNSFVCLKCGWNCTATLVGAPVKCGGCGSKEFLERAIVVTKKGKVNKPVYIKFNPDTNNYKNKVMQKADVDIKEIASQTNSTKIKEDNKIMEDEKTYKIKCSNQNCLFEYETQEADLNTHRHKQCQVCGRPTIATKK